MEELYHKLSCCWKRSDKDRYTVGNMSMADFNALTAERMSLDFNLESLVQNWEKSVNAYRDYEEAIFDDIENHPACDEILSVLERLRDHPEEFKGSAQEDIANLANLRCEIYICQTRLGLPRVPHSGEPMSGSGSGSGTGVDGDGDSAKEGSGEVREDMNPMHQGANGAPKKSSSKSTSQKPQSGADSDSDSVAPRIRQKMSFSTLLPPVRDSSVTSGSGSGKSGNDSGTTAGAGDAAAAAAKASAAAQTDTAATKLQRRIDRLRADPLLHRSKATMQKLEKSPDYSSYKHAPMMRQGAPVFEIGGPGGVGSMTSAELKARAEAGADVRRQTLRTDLHSNNAISNQLSLTWSGRLDKVNMTQGQLQTAPAAGAGGGEEAHGDVTHATPSSSSRTAVVKIKPKWPHFLLDIWFDVVKWNDFGRKQRRILKLTEYHILNIKNGTTISKLYWYVDISRIWLENSNTLKIVLKERSEPICYLSPMAPSIVQQITTRVQVRIALEKTVFTATRHMFDTAGSGARSGGDHDAADDAFSFSFSHAAAAQMIETIGAEADAVGDDVMADFAMGLVGKIAGVSVRPSNTRFGSSASSMNQSAVGMFGNGSSSGGGGGGGSHNGRDKPALQQHRSQPRLFVFSAGSLEDMVQKEVQKVVFDGKTDEGHTRDVFVDSFDGAQQQPQPKRSLTRATPKQQDAQAGGAAAAAAAAKKTLLDVRHFIDGLHEYYLSSHGIEMTILMSAWIKDNEKSTAGASGAGAGAGAETGAGVGDLSPRASHSTALSSFAGRDRASSSALTEIAGAGTGAGRAPRKSVAGVPRLSIRGLTHTQDLLQSSLGESHLAMLSFISFTVIEEAVFLPLRDSILQRLPTYNTNRDEELAKKVRRLSARTQEQWGIPAALRSPLKWETACFELAGVERASTPSMQLTALARACKAITSEFKNCIVPEMRKKGKTDTHLGADDLVPIFVYVFCKAALRTPHVYKDLMWTLCHPDQLHGECGYYLTVFESAIEYVEIEPLDDIPVSAAASASANAPAGAGSDSEPGRTGRRSFDDVPPPLASPSPSPSPSSADGPQAHAQLESAPKFGGVNADSQAQAQAPEDSSSASSGLRNLSGDSASGSSMGGVGSGSGSGKFGGKSSASAAAAGAGAATRRLTVKEQVAAAVGLRAPPKFSMHVDFESSPAGNDDGDDADGNGNEQYQQQQQQQQQQDSIGGGGDRLEGK